MVDSPQASDERCALLDRFAAAWPPDRWIARRVLVACSGGPDSVALAAALIELARSTKASPRAAPGEPRGEIVLAHVHHGLRADADRDAEIVEALAARLDVPYESARVTLPRETARGEGVEGLARRLRYDALERIAQRRGSRYLVTAHHAEDQAETVLFRLLRGTGETGLVGVARRRRLGPYLTLVRPCLGMPKALLRSFAEERGLPFVVDPMNDDRRHLRNRIRHELLPLLQERFFSDAVAALGRLADDAVERRAFVERQAAEYLDRHAVRDSDAISVDFAEACGAGGPFFVREILRLLWMRNGWPRQNMSRARWVELERRISRVDGADPCVLPGGVRATWRSAGTWIFAAPPTGEHPGEFG